MLCFFIIAPLPDFFLFPLRKKKRKRKKKKNKTLKECALNFIFDLFFFSLALPPTRMGWAAKQRVNLMVKVLCYGHKDTSSTLVRV